jgi:hypothetical protein
MGWLSTIFSRAVGFIPILGPLAAQLLTSWSTRNAEAERAKAETERIEAEAFKRGRISPRYLLGYVKVGIYILAAILIVVALFSPESANVADDVINSLSKAGKLVEGVAP